MQLAESWLVRLASMVPWIDKILVERTVYEAACRLVDEHGADADKIALQRAHDPAADRRTAAFWLTVHIYLGERAKFPRKGLDIVEDAARGWGANINWNREPEDLSHIDFSGRRKDAAAEAEKRAKEPPDMERLIQDLGKKKGGGSR
jgi:hypothetical protein